MTEIYQGYNEKGINPAHPNMHVAFGFDTFGLLQINKEADDKFGEAGTFYGYAKAGTANNESEWLIYKILTEPDPVTGKYKIFADNVADFTKTWNDRASYSYT